jgi:hypothetical protein
VEEKIMRTERHHFLLSLSILTTLSLVIAATNNAQEGKGIDMGEAEIIMSEVLAIDKEDRILTIRGLDKNPLEVQVTENANNFEKIRVGDQIRAEIYNPVVIYLGELGAKPEEGIGMVVEWSAKGEAPGGRAVGTLDARASVEGIDKKNRTVTLELPGRSVVTARVDKSVKTFDTLKVGDTIHARLIKALAISVETTER